MTKIIGRYSNEYKTFDQFDVMTDAELSTVEGGGWVKCGLGTVGSALTGGVAGAAVGTVTLPIFWDSIWDCSWFLGRCSDWSCYILLKVLII